MVLTWDEEQRLLEDYSKIVWKIVRRFCGGKRSSIFEPEDLYQEGMIVLIHHMKQAKTREELRKFQSMEIVNVLTRYVLGAQAVSLDVNRTSTAKKTLNNMSGTVCYDEQLTLAAPCEDEDVLIDFDAFMDTLPKAQQEILRLKKQGLNNKEVAARRNITAQAVSQAVRRAHQAYAAFAA